MNFLKLFSKTAREEARRERALQKFERARSLANLHANEKTYSNHRGGRRAAEREFGK